MEIVLTPFFLSHLRASSFTLDFSLLLLDIGSVRVSDNMRRIVVPEYVDLSEKVRRRYTKAGTGGQTRL